MNTQLLFLWQRYFFNRDIGDLSSANYWLKRIEEFNKQNTGANTPHIFPQHNKNPKQ